jgi:EsV-1-7 cysteine-rich motif
MSEIPKYCKKHIIGDMVNVVRKHCAQPDCDKRPYYNVYTSKIPKYCKKHIIGDMVNVVYKRCAQPDCNINPNFNVCTSKIPKYCKKHIIGDMVDVVNKRCIGQEGTCTTFVTRNYRGYCLHCFMHIFPNEPVSRNYKTKEKVVVDRIRSFFPEFVWRHDKIIECGTSQRRPDLFLDVGSHILIIEIDEDSHKSYDCSCEDKRLMQLSLDVSSSGHRDIVLIRFNPDKYTDAQGNVHKSCFYRNKNGVIVLANTPGWEHRIAELIKTIKFWITKEPEKTILVLWSD